MKDKGKQLGDNKRRLAVEALHETLDMLGKPSKKALLSALEQDYGIDFSENGSSPERIESALVNMFGPGAQVIIKEWKKKIS